MVASPAAPAMVAAAAATARAAVPLLARVARGEGGAGTLPPPPPCQRPRRPAAPHGRPHRRRQRRWRARPGGAAWAAFLPLPAAAVPRMRGTAAERHPPPPLPRRPPPHPPPAGAPTAIYAEAWALLQCRGKRGIPNAPVVVLVDEVSKTTLLKAGGDLAKWLVAKDGGGSMRGTHAAIASDLLNAACTLTDKIGGVTFASSLDYTTMSEATTISGRRVLPVDNLFCPDPEQLSCIIYKGLSTLASKGFMMTRDAEKSDACSALFQNIRTDLFVARETRTQPQPSAMSQVQLQSSAKGLSYLCGGHMRTAVDLAIWLTQAGSLVRPHRPHVSIKMLMEKIQHAASSAIAEHAWNLADAADIDYVLSVVLLDLPVSESGQIFSVTRRAASPMSSSKIPSVWDEARYFSVVLGSGRVFRPRLPPLALYWVW